MRARRTRRRWRNSTSARRQRRLVELKLIQVGGSPARSGGPHHDVCECRRIDFARVTRARVRVRARRLHHHQGLVRRQGRQESRRNRPNSPSITPTATVARCGRSAPARAKDRSACARARRSPTAGCTWPRSRAASRARPADRRGAVELRAEPKSKTSPTCACPAVPAWAAAWSSIGGLDGEVIALDASHRRREVEGARSAPKSSPRRSSANGLVIVRSNDGRVTAFDAANRRAPLVLAARPACAHRARQRRACCSAPASCSSATTTARVAALSTQDGRLLWEQAVAQAEGRSELDRMADIDGTPVLDGTTIYATSFKKADHGDRRPDRPPDLGSATTAAPAASATRRDRAGRGRPGRHRVGHRQGHRRRAVVAACARAPQADAAWRCRAITPWSPTSTVTCTGCAWPTARSPRATRVGGR